MKTILQLDTSLYSAEGQSSHLAKAFVQALSERHPEVKVVHRDLAREQVPHLDAGRFGAFTAPPETRTPAQQAIVDYSDLLIEEVRDADALVIGLPMYNFGVPSQFKAWIDHIARAGVTFQYTENGPVGLLSGKEAYVLATRGGRYAGTASDTQTQYVRDILNFLGIEDVDFVYAEGLAMGDETRDESVNAAHSDIHQLALQSRAA